MCLALKEGLMQRSVFPFDIDFKAASGEKALNTAVSPDLGQCGQQFDYCVSLLCAAMGLQEHNRHRLNMI